MYDLNCPVACIAIAKAGLPAKDSFGLAAAFGGQWLRHTDGALHAFLLSCPSSVVPGVCAVTHSLIFLCLVLSLAHCLAINEIQHRGKQ